MSISLSGSSVPVNSHPLSSDDLPSKTTRRRTRGRDDHHKQTGPRPATSHFPASKSAFVQDHGLEEATLNGYAHYTYSPHRKTRDTAAWDGSVRGPTRRRHDGASISGTMRTRSSTLSLVWERPSVPLFIVGSSTSEVLTSSPATPNVQRPIFALSSSPGEGHTLHDLSPRAASHVLETPFHTLNDQAIQSAISNISVLSEEENANVAHPYHSALRILSEAVEKLRRARVELEEGRKRLFEKQAKIRELVAEDHDSELNLRESILAVIEESDNDLDHGYVDDGSNVEFALRDSLSLALSEDLTQPNLDDRPHTPSSVATSLTPPDSELLDRTQTSLPPSLIVSSESRGTLFSSDNGDRPPDADDTSSSQIQYLSRSSSPPPSHNARTKSRANSSASLVSMSSTTSKGLGDWMSWFGKGRAPHRHRDLPKMGSESSEDTTSVGGGNSEYAPDEKSGPETQKPTSTMRGMLNALRIGSPPQEGPLPNKSATRDQKRKTSISILSKPSGSASALNSPVLSGFFVPPPAPAPPIAVFYEQQVEEGTETTSIHSSALFSRQADRYKDEHVQGSTLRALVNATRVMTTDPSSILVEDAGELVKRLAWELVCGVRDNGITFREPMKSKPKAKTAASSISEQVEDGEEKRANRAVAAVKNLGPGGTLIGEKPRKTSALGALANPLLGGFATGTAKIRLSSPTVRDEGVSGTVSVPPAGSAGTSEQTLTAVSPLSVPLESIIPAKAKPPTQYLARTYSSIISPDFRPPSWFTSERFATSGAELITDRYGFVYEVSSYDVLLLDRALRAGNSAPGCLTGIKVADREEDDEWDENSKEFEVVRGSCTCIEGVRPQDDEADQQDATSVESAGPSRRSGTKRRIANYTTKTSRAITLSAPLNVASLEYLPAPEGSFLIPTHACPNTVRTQVAHITKFHDEKQTRLQMEWNTFLRARRDAKKTVKASAVSAARSWTAAAMLGLDPQSENVEEEGLVGFSQMGLASNYAERREFKRLVRGGIPLVYRAKVWLECSGALEMAEPGVFRDLLVDAEREGGIAIGEIEKDVGRTMPLNVFFGGNGVGVDKLRRVLRAYSRRNQSVGYCQGMNLVASTLLLVHANEEDAFWNFSCIIEKCLPEDFFSPSLLVSRACPLVLLDYVHDLMPAVFDHLTELGVDLPAICFSWFLSLFTDCLPVETLFRVWDVFIVDGLDVLFRIALAILRINEAELLQARSVPALYVALESLPTRMWEVDKLLKHEADLRPYVVFADIILKRDARVRELQGLAA